MRAAVLTMAVLASHSANAAVVDVFSDRVDFEIAAGSLVVETFDSTVADKSFVDRDVAFGGISLRADNVNTASIDVPSFAPGAFNIDTTPYLRVFLQSKNDFFRISFDAPVTMFGADFRNLNDRGNGSRDTLFSVLGQNTLLPTASRGETSFFGIISDTAFSEVLFTRGGRDAKFGLDNVQTGSDQVASVADVPLQSAGLLLAFGLGGLAYANRRYGAKTS